MAVKLPDYSDPVYLASDEVVANSHCPSLADYRRLYAESVDNPEQFWSTIAAQFHWHQPKPAGKFCEYNFDVNSGRVFVEWMKGAVTNISYNALDRHVLNGGADRVAFHWEGNELADTDRITYGELLRQVCKFGSVLRAEGVRRGDCVAIYMPMIPELVVAMLACARIGAVHSIVFGGFSADALSERIMDAKCRLLVTADGVWRGSKLINLKQIADHAVDICESAGFSVSRVIAVQHLPRLAQHKNTTSSGSSNTPNSLSTTDSTADCDPAGCRPTWVNGRDVWWHDIMSSACDQCPVEWMDAEDPLFLLYTSGSTGRPKGVLHTVGGYMLYVATTFRYTFDHHAAGEGGGSGDIYWCTADIGWITGHSYVVYGPMLNAATSVMFEGTPFHPTGERMWQIVDKYKVTKFYTAPTAIRALMRLGDDLVTRSSRASLRVLGSVGEPINPEAWHWYHRVVGDRRCSIVDTFWQTETGGHVITPLPAAVPMKPGSAAVPFFGVVPRLLDSDGREVVGEGEGYLVFERPWPGMMRTVFGDHSRYEQTYFARFPGFYCTGDGARRDADGYLWLTGRIDDMLNVSGHLLSTAQIESAMVEHESVAEAAVVAVPHSVKGEAVYAFVTSKQGVDWTDSLKKELIMKVREKIGPFAAPDYIQPAPALPKTRSGKIMRRVLRKIASGDRQLGDVSTMADSSVVDQLFDNRCQL